MSDATLTTAALGAAILAAVVAILVGMVVLARLAALARMREETAGSLAALATSVEVLKSLSQDLERDLKDELRGARGDQKQDLAIARAEQAQAAQTLRGEVGERVAHFTASTQQQLSGLTQAQAEALRSFAERLDQFAQRTQQSLRDGADLQIAQSKAVEERIVVLTQANDRKLEAIRANVELKLDQLRSENSAKLEQMRATVDEKLQQTLETRLGASFKQVSDRLEQVHKGLGEMQSLAVGVGDLKRVLTNVKTRGTWGEVRLDALLADLLAPSQYDRNVATRPDILERVDFALRLPGRDEGASVCWLPIDAKFPAEEWQRLQDAVERADAAAVEGHRRALDAFFKAEARSIHDKYVEPPHTTDFAILFVPTEGLFAEAVARPGLAEAIQRDYRVTLAGPTTLAAMLNSLQLGFRTLAIEKRSTEVWRVLGAVKTEFGRFGDLLVKTRERLDSVGKTLDDAGRKSRTIARKLRDVEALPEAEADRLLTGESAVLDVESDGDGEVSSDAK